ncbi:Phytanoyl-CoA dioxygenase (PhyH) [Seminavis robusta]|uniref:Phytanoyl-CoA dioxygenase (PhyH) n=1 Tax=Seminavis robusta TaxID=568900 RepID=A0A9N8E8G6_9STRA|nr:Phytanoyl-CoA dioxygenase (PhyH) [Seminavis robusta]|eukprot:Sro799_g204080.1 Phytanoyl-CoA dioxygenase (PhyH) (304) ;mRNA; f:12157-13068
MDDESLVLAKLREDLRRQGYVRIPKSLFCLDDSRVEALRASFARLFDGHYETGIYPDEIHWRKGISRETATREICNGWKADGCVADTVLSPQLGRLACALMEWSSSRMGQDDVLHKPPQSGPVGFHQDGAYISDNFTPEQDNCLTMWIALDDADGENGALQYAPGSHLWTQQPPSLTEPDEKDNNMKTLSFHVGEGKDHIDSLRQAAAELGRDPLQAVASVRTVPVSTGEMVVHLQNTWHGSGPNTSKDRQRRALVAHLLDGQVKWSSTTKPHYIYGRYYIKGEFTPRDDFFPFTYRTTNAHH